MTDVCVIGAGVAGALVACELAEAGRSVVLLDTGARLDEAPAERYERVRLGLDPWEWEDPERDAFEASSELAAGVNGSRMKCVGGTTLHWNAYAPRLQPADFELRSRFGIARDWPFAYDAIEPFYVRAERALGVAGADAPGAPPRSAPYPLSPHPYSHADSTFFFPAFGAAGLSLGANPMAVNSEAYDGRSTCLGFATCWPMCPSRAKYTAMVHIRRAEATGNVEVRAQCHVRRLRLAADRRVGGVDCVDAAGRAESIEAKAFVLAAGGVENARLLLLSAADGRHRDGLGNASGLVGRTLMSHTLAGVRATLHERVGGHRLGYGTTLSWDLYDHATYPHAGNVLLFPSDLQGPTPAQIARADGSWGHALQERVRDGYGYNVKLVAEGDMLPHPDNRIALSTTQRDRHGDPVPVVTLRTSAFDEATIARGHEAGRRVLSHLQPRALWTDQGVFLAHFLGTTAMGTDPGAAVCDGIGRCHELDNLYIAGSSLFPTSGAAHPTLLIAALAIRTGEHLARSV